MKGAFLKGDLNHKIERMAIRVPQGFEKYYDKNIVLLLLMAIYGTKQVEMSFWKEFLKCMKHIEYVRSGTDPCLYFKWTVAGLVVWLS